MHSLESCAILRREANHPQKIKMKTFYFNTGVKPFNHLPAVPVMPGNVIRAGTIQIPFDCEEVPDGAVFLYGCDTIKPGLDKSVIYREMKNTNMVSKYAFFRVIPPAPPMDGTVL